MIVALDEGLYSVKFTSSLSAYPQLPDLQGVCDGTEITIEDISGSVTTSWAISDASDHNFSTVGTGSIVLTDLDAAEHEEITITVGITNNNCSYLISRTYPIISGTINTENWGISIDLGGFNACNPNFSFSANGVVSGNSFEWNCFPSGLLSCESDGNQFAFASAVLEPGTSLEFTVEVTIEYGCNETVTLIENFTHYAHPSDCDMFIIQPGSGQGDGDLVIDYFPNPVDHNVLTVMLGEVSGA